jgi:hypothetical protein
MQNYLVIMEDDTNYHVTAHDDQSAAYEGCRRWVRDHLGVDDRLDKYFDLLADNRTISSIIEMAMDHDMSCPVHDVHWVFVDPSMD